MDWQHLAPTEFLVSSEVPLPLEAPSTHTPKGSLLGLPVCSTRVLLPAWGHFIYSFPAWYYPLLSVLTQKVQLFFHSQRLQVIWSLHLFFTSWQGLFFFNSPNSTCLGNLLSSILPRSSNHLLSRMMSTMDQAMPNLLASDLEVILCSHRWNLVTPKIVHTYMLWASHMLCLKSPGLCSIHQHWHHLSHVHCSLCWYWESGFAEDRHPQTAKGPRSLVDPALHIPHDLHITGTEPKYVNCSTISISSPSNLNWSNILFAQLITHSHPPCPFRADCHPAPDTNLQATDSMVILELVNRATSSAN